MLVEVRETLSSVAKLVLGFGLLLAIGAAVIGFTVPVGMPWMECSGALASSHPGAEHVAQMAKSGTGYAFAPADCAREANAARPGYIAVIVIGAIIAFAGLLIAAKKPKFFPTATELASLATLRDQGNITQTEFDAQKRRLLGHGPSGLADLTSNIVEITIADSGFDGEERYTAPAQVVEDLARVSASNPEKTIKRAIIGVHWNELGSRQANGTYKGMNPGWGVLPGHRQSQKQDLPAPGLAFAHTDESDFCCADDCGKGQWQRRKRSSNFS